ncbi:MAG: transglutaminase domain-containing protein [Armatimonadetes bacterium]|nr:transglutaminase domain-containing protein [Armatimonadota bacterium]
MKKILNLFWIGILLILLSCTVTHYSDSISQTLKDAGNNKKEIKKAISYFQVKEDSLQLNALYFILENLKNHCYVEFALYDSNKVEIPFNILDYKNYDETILALDSLEEINGELNWKRKKKSEDIETITSELLIENIELAFKAWQQKSWAKDFSYDEFREYILPYRGSSEPLESWRPFFLERYENLSEEMNDPTDPIEAARLINEDVKSLFGFDARFYCHPTDQGLSEMLKNELGRCEDMTNFTIYALRANALPITSDYTPHWADTGNNHAWNTIIMPGGKAVPFMGAEANPGDYNLHHKLAKAYRKTFSEQKDNLAFKLNEGEKAPPWLTGKNYLDVTPTYTEISDVTLKINYDIPDSTRFAYLCVFNAGEWKAIHWGKINSLNNVTFDKMGVDIAYLPMFYVNKELISAGFAFILENDGTLRELNKSETTKNLKLISVTKKTIKQATENKEIIFLDEDAEYELFFWEDEWISLGEKNCNVEPLLFEDVPSNCLYWLVKKDSRKEERIFTYENGNQVWW